MLNPQQTAAVRYLDGPLLVLAGAGSGKTRVITQKIAYLINECGHAANAIFAVTFTNKAANEMRERVAKVIPAKQRKGLKVATFHTLGLSILKKEVIHCNLRPGFSIFDSEDSAQLIKQFLPPARANDKETLRGIQVLISRWKNEFSTIDSIATQPPDHPLFELAFAIFPRYQETLRTYNAVDFDDLISLPVLLFQKYPEICERWQNKVRHLLVDEYQDSNACQYHLVKHLVGKTAQFTVVGDDDQSIYAWRGAKPENLGQLQKDYPNLKVIKLEQNYRSTLRILRAANQLIANNPHLFDKQLWSELGLGDYIKVMCCRDELDEADQVVADLISHKMRNAFNYGDYAILYRGNHQSRLFEKVLRNHGIPYKISGGQSWFAHAEVKDIFAYLKLLCNPEDDASFLRIINTPKRGIGEASLSALADYAQKANKSLFNCCDHLALQEIIGEKQRNAFAKIRKTLSSLSTKILEIPQIVQLLKEFIEEISYEAYVYEQSETPLKAQKRMDNVWELIDWVGRLMEKEPGIMLTDVINKLILVDILEQADDHDKERVQLLTLHASKGLEFPYVYLVGMEEDILPHKVSIDDNQIEEERRLAYVGLTRAQKAICFSLAKKRRKGSELQQCLPSRFLDELPQDDMEWFGRGERNEEQSKVLAQSHLQGLKNLLVK
jgi:ATP-dependent DNA helicase Rep